MTMSVLLQESPDTPDPDSPLSLLPQLTFQNTVTPLSKNRQWLPWPQN
jgi:hypothetical protein